MVKIYASLIKKGLKTLDDVPENLRAEVEALLYKMQKPFGPKDCTLVNNQTMERSETSGKDCIYSF